MNEYEYEYGEPVAWLFEELPSSDEARILLQHMDNKAFYSQPNCQPINLVTCEISILKSAQILNNLLML